MLLPVTLQRKLNRLRLTNELMLTPTRCSEHRKDAHKSQHDNDSNKYGGLRFHDLCVIRRPKLSHPARGTQRLQPRRPRRVRCSIRLGHNLLQETPCSALKSIMAS